MQALVLIMFRGSGAAQPVLTALPREMLASDEVRFLILNETTAAPGRGMEIARWRDESGARHVDVVQHSLALASGACQKLGLRYALDRGFDLVIVTPEDPDADGSILGEVLVRGAAGGADVVVGIARRGPASQRPAVAPALSQAGAVSPRTRPGACRRDLPRAYRGYSTRFLSTIPFEMNANDARFDFEVLLQAEHAGATVLTVEAGGVTPGWRTRPRLSLAEAGALLSSLAQFRLHRAGMLCSLKYRDLGPVRYANKTAVLYSSHATALALTREFGPRRLLDIGCGSGFVASQCTAAGIEVTGVDIRPPMPGSMRHFIRADLDREALPVDPCGFDLILMLDTIEHFARPEQFLIDLRNRAPAGTPAELLPRMVLSTPNVAFIAMRLNLLLGRFNYAERGILDITHKRLFTLSSLLRLLRDCGYVTERVIPVAAPFEAVFGGWLGSLLGRANRFLLVLWRRLFAFQFIVVCRPLPNIRQLLHHNAPSLRQAAGVPAATEGCVGSSGA